MSVLDLSLALMMKSSINQVCPTDAQEENFSSPKLALLLKRCRPGQEYPDPLITSLSFKAATAWFYCMALHLSAFWMFHSPPMKAFSLLYSTFIFFGGGNSSSRCEIVKYTTFTFTLLSFMIKSTHLCC